MRLPPADTTSDILFLPISGPRGASSRYRLYQYLPAIADAGLSYEIVLPPAPRGRGLGRLFTALGEARDLGFKAAGAKLVFIQKRLLSERAVSEISHHAPIVFDFDDAIFTTPRGDRSRFTQKRVERRLSTVLSAAGTVIAGNAVLADFARQYAQHVVWLPTVVDANRYPAREHQDTGKLTIGWIGHSVNHPYLASLEGAIREVASRFPIRLLVISDHDFIMNGVEVENRRWAERSEVADILEMDIGIMPMPDDPWSRGKCGLKAIQYMAAGVPVVCDAVGANIEIVRNEIDGYAVTSRGEWVARLTQLCASPTLRQSIGGVARERVAVAFSLQSTTQRFLGVLGRYIVREGD